MNKSDSIKELALAYAKAQPEIEGATKDKTNPAFRSKYADLGNVVDAIKPALGKHGLSFVQLSHEAEAAAKIETILLHGSGEWLSMGTICVPVTKHDAHGFGSALTYARRYGLLTAFGVAPEDDDGNAAAKAVPQHGATPTGGVWDSLSIDQQNHLMDIHHRVHSLLLKGDVAGAYAELTADDLGGKEDMKVGLWSRFDSKERRALGDYGDKLRKPAGERAAA